MTIAALEQIGKDINGIAESGKARVMSAIKAAAAKTGVDFSYLVQKAQTESSFNPTAQAKTSSARGLYQFVNSTWLDTLDKHAEKYGRADLAAAIDRRNGVAYVADPAKRKEILALRDNPELAACMAAELASDNAACLKAKTGAEVGGTELYMAHFLGAGGASQFLNKMAASPNAAAASVMPQAAAANHGVFYTEGGRARTLQEVYDRFAVKFGETGGASVAATATVPDEVQKSIDLAQAILPTGGKNKNPFDAFTVGYDDRARQTESNRASLYQPVSTNQLSATGDIYRFGGGQGLGTQPDMGSALYALWLADHGKVDDKIAGSI